MNKKQYSSYCNDLICRINKHFPNSEFQNWKLWGDDEILLSNAKILYDHIVEYNIKTETASQLIKRTADYLINVKHDYEYALGLYQKVLDINKFLYGEDNQKTINTFNYIADLYKTIGNHYLDYKFYESALLIYKQTFKIIENSEKYPDIAISLYKIARLYYDQKDYVNSLFYYQKALDFTECFLVGDYKIITKILSGFASLYETQGDFILAIKLSKRALLMVESFLGKEHIEITTFLNKLAKIYADTTEIKALQEALSLAKRSLKIRHSFLEKNHPDIAINNSLLGSIHDQLKEYDKAFAFYQRALNINKQIYGKNNIIVADGYYIIATIYKKMNKYDKALKFFNEAVNLYMNLSDKNYAHIALVYKEMALIHKVKNEHEKVKILLQKVSKISKKVEDQHPDLIEKNANFVSYYKENMCNYSYASALPLSHFLLKTKEELLGKDHFDISTCLNNLGFIYENSQKDYSSASSAYKKSLAIQKNIFGENHPYLIQIFNTLARLNNNNF